MHQLKFDEEWNCAKQNNSPKDTHALIPGTCEYVVSFSKGELKLQLRMKFKMELRMLTLK